MTTQVNIIRLQKLESLERDIKIIGGVDYDIKQAKNCIIEFKNKSEKILIN